MSSGTGSNDPLNKGQHGPPLPLPPKKSKKKSSTPTVVTSQQQRCYPIIAAANPSPSVEGLARNQNLLLPSGMAFTMNNWPFSMSMAPSAAATSSSGAHARGTSSSFFKGWKLRSGKWLDEEEAYADLLIKMFDRGQLSDCVTGSTMRAYLAQKLHCAPMRISKKFAGKGIGKKVYSSRIDTGNNVSTEVTEHRRKIQNEVNVVQKAFHDAASSDAVSLSCLTHVCT